MADETKAAPPTTAPSPSQTAKQIAVLTLIAVVIANLMFYFLSDFYYAEKKFITPTEKETAINSARVAFVVFTGAIGLASVLATFRPGVVGHGLAAIGGVSSVFAAIGALGRDMPMVLPVTLLILGGTLPALAYYSMQKKVRAAWSFLIALCGVFATVLLFGAPKVRGVLGIGFWNALIIPGLLTVATIALSRVSSDYQEA